MINYYYFYISVFKDEIVDGVRFVYCLSAVGTGWRGGGKTWLANLCRNYYFAGKKIGFRLSDTVFYTAMRRKPNYAELI